MTEVAGVNNHAYPWVPLTDFAEYFDRSIRRRVVNDDLLIRVWLAVSRRERVNGGSDLATQLFNIVDLVEAAADNAQKGHVRPHYPDRRRLIFIPLSSFTRYGQECATQHRCLVNAPA